MHLSTVRSSAVKLFRNPLLNQKKVESYFFPGNYKSFLPPKRPPRFPTNGIAVFRFQVEDKSLSVFKSAESESAVHLGEILLVGLEPIGIHFLEKSLNLNRIVAGTVLEGFLEAASSNLMSVRR